MKKKMKNRICGLAAAAFCLAASCCALPVLASGEVPSYVEIPEEGSYTIGGENKSEDVDGSGRLWTDFYLYVKNPEKDKVETPGKQTPGKLPKTGDYGMDKNALLLAALIFGSGYLACEYYEKKKA